MRFELVISTWELECCGPALAPGSTLDVTLTGQHWPELAQALDWPGVPQHDALVWVEPPRPGQNRFDFLVCGSIHGPERGPRVPVVVEEIREVRADLEPDPSGPPDAVRLRAVSLRLTRRYSVPEPFRSSEFGGGADWPSSDTVAVALVVRG